jgi:hypothetical protein
VDVFHPTPRLRNIPGNIPPTINVPPDRFLLDLAPVPARTISAIHHQY